MKHGSGINGRDDRSIGVETHMTDVFSKINPTKSRIRVRGGVRRLSCSWVFLQDYTVFYLNITPFFTSHSRNVVDLNFSLTCLQMISIQIIMKICYMYTTKEVQLKPESVHETRSEPNLPKWKREPIIICVTFDIAEEIQRSTLKIVQIPDPWFPSVNTCSRYYHHWYTEVRGEQKPLKVKLRRETIIISSKWISGHEAYLLWYNWWMPKVFKWKCE